MKHYIMTINTYSSKPVNSNRVMKSVTCIYPTKELLDAALMLRENFIYEKYCGYHINKIKNKSESYMDSDKHIKTSDYSFNIKDPNNIETSDLHPDISIQVYIYEQDFIDSFESLEEYERILADSDLVEQIL